MKPNLDGREYSEQLGFWRLLPPQSIEVFFSQTGPLILEPVILVHLRLLVINLIHRMNSKKKWITSQELQEEMDNLSDITEEGDLSDLDPNFNSHNSEFGEKSGSSSDNSDAEIIQAEG
ncbi:hypothetical protein QE152_g11415 [Popillia japonica]|uniref:Uncharacterized protein n=1 Tax=Popillia japonica TaxID=7064 RepID=A0AAW1LRT6_POPJA